MKALTEEQKEAARRRAREWAARNRDKVRERSRRRAKDPDVKAYQKAYRDARQAERREYNRQWRAAHPELVKKYAADYRARDPERARAHSRNWQRNSLGMPEATRPCPTNCECCGALTVRMHLDHCHVTGKFRGWLCGSCNRGIGLLGDHVEGARKAVDYLTKFG